MVVHTNPITLEAEQYFVHTDERTEYFASLDAAQAFIDMHCLSRIHGNNVERLLRTNAIK